MLCLEDIFFGVERCQALCSPDKIDLIIQTHKLFCLTNWLF